MLRTVLALGIFLVLTGSSFACSCVNNNATACSSLAGTPVVFVGRVIRDTGGEIGTRFGRMAVEQVLHGLPTGLAEVDVDTMPSTSCFMPLEGGERYVIYGSRDPKDPNLVHYHSCSFSFRVRGHESLLDALLASEAGRSVAFDWSCDKKDREVRRWRPRAGNQGGRTTGYNA